MTDLENEDGRSCIINVINDSVVALTNAVGELEAFEFFRSEGSRIVCQSQDSPCDAFAINAAVDLFDILRPRMASG
jgi:hypothetical protein